MAELFHKVWSPNSPFGRESSVFSGREAASLCARGKARLAEFKDAMAALTGHVEPLRWSPKWLREKFIKMGMPRGCGDEVLVFQGEFVSAIHRVAMDDVADALETAGMDKMVDAMRGGEGRTGMAVWAGRPMVSSKVPGAPVGKVRCMEIRFRVAK